MQNYADFASLVDNTNYSIFFHVNAVLMFTVDVIGIFVLEHNGGFSSTNPAIIWLIFQIIFSLGSIVMVVISMVLSDFFNKETITACGTPFVVKVISMAIFLTSTFIFAIIGIFIVPMNYSLAHPNPNGNMAVAVLSFQWPILVVSVGFGFMMHFL